MKKLMALLLALVMVMSLAACGEQKTNENKGDAASGDANTPAEITYAVEASQANALMEVDAGTADAAIIDLLMAGAMVGEGTSYPDLKVTDQKLNSELYGVGCRKGSDLTSFINSVMSAAYADGTMVELAKSPCWSSPPVSSPPPSPTVMCSTFRTRAS